MVGSSRSISLSLSAVLLLLAHGTLTAHAPESPRLGLIPAQPGHGINTTLANPREVDSILFPLGKRQRNCPTGCRYCCEDSICVPSLADVCCGGYYCYAGDTCSNSHGCCLRGSKVCHDGCIPDGGECCRSGNWCEPGLYCYLIDGDRPACCPPGGCYGNDYYEYTTSDITEYTTTAYKTTEYTTTDYTTSTSTYVDWDYYTRTITWTYWVTFYTYFTPSSTEIRTSTTTTTTTVASVIATDPAEASSSLDEISATLTYTVPSTATDPPRPTISETGTPGSGDSDPGIRRTNPFGSGGGGGGDTNKSVVMRPTFNALWYGLATLIGAVIMPGVLAVCL